jgi:hypothetical protein
MMGRTFLELAREAGIDAPEADRVRKQWLAQYPDIARFFDLVEKKPPVQDLGYLDGEGTYRVKILSKGWKPTRRGDFYIVEFEILETDNERHPVGAIRSHVCRTPYVPANIDRTAEGGEMQLRTRESVTKRGLSFTNHSWTPASLNMRNQPSQDVPVKLVLQEGETVTYAENRVSYGATCKRCNTFNEHAEARADFVCFGCRV